jgi:hypothetical protein
MAETGIASARTDIAILKPKVAKMTELEEVKQRRFSSRVVV